MENLLFYDHLRAVPPEAKKEIKGGRLAGKTDINPMWRIKALTEAFGPCGIGWKYEVTGKELCPGANGEVAAFVHINLYIKVDGAWSDPIPGTGGASFVAQERGGLYTSDECYKMALTDAISVSCKALGVAADVYWEKDSTKYDRLATDKSIQPPGPPCEECGREIMPFNNGKNALTAARMAQQTKDAYGKALCYACAKAAKQDKEAVQEGTV